jgi:hypothetical protein
MGIRYICDSCGKEFDVKGGIGPDGHPVSYRMPLEKWATFSYLAPKAKEEPAPGQTGRIYGMYQEDMPVGYLVCSQACAEKKLAEISKRLQAAFDEVAG